MAEVVMETDPAPETVMLSPVLLQQALCGAFRLQGRARQVQYALCYRGCEFPVTCHADCGIEDERRGQRRRRKAADRMTCLYWIHGNGRVI